MEVMEEACENGFGILLFCNRTSIEMLALCFLGSFPGLGTLFDLSLSLSLSSSLPLSPSLGHQGFWAFQDFSCLSKYWTTEGLVKLQPTHGDKICLLACARPHCMAPPLTMSHRRCKLTRSYSSVLPLFAGTVWNSKRTARSLLTPVSRKRCTNPSYALPTSAALSESSLKTTRSGSQIGGTTEEQLMTSCPSSRGRSVPLRSSLRN